MTIQKEEKFAVKYSTSCVVKVIEEHAIGMCGFDPDYFESDSITYYFNGKAIQSNKLKDLLPNIEVIIINPKLVKDNKG